MPEEPKRYWQSLEVLRREPAAMAEAALEFPGGLPDGPGRLAADRRTFLQTLGFSLAAAGLAGCETPVQKVIPFLNRPEGMVPGRATWYATTCGACRARCGLLAKVMDGRVVKVEGNPEHLRSRGGLCALGQAQVVEVYDAGRPPGPRIDGGAASWEETDAAVRSGLEEARASGRDIVLLSGPLDGPTDRAAVEAFLAAWPGAREVTWSPTEGGAAAEAHRRLFGTALLPALRLDRARLVVAVDSDFLVRPAPVPIIKDYAAARRPERRQQMLRHVQFEARLSLTGSNADARTPLDPRDRHAAVALIAARVARHAGRAGTGAIPEEAARLIEERAGSLPDDLQGRLTAAAGALWEARGEAVLLCDDEDADLQTMVAAVNRLLEAYGGVLDTGRVHGAPDPAGMRALQEDLEAGRIGALLLWDINPAYAHPKAPQWARWLESVPFSAALSGTSDETASRCRVLAPLPHPLEAWGDAEAEAGRLSLLQPAMAPLRDTREGFATLMAWAGSPAPSLEILQRLWRERVYPRRSGTNDWFSFWDRALQSGYVETRPAPVPLRTASPRWAAGAEAAARLSRVPGRSEGPEARGTLSLLLYEKVGIRDGRGAGNPYLQELPDPVTKATWTNYACLGPDTAAGLSLDEGDLLRLEATDEAIAVTLPVLVQPGQAPATVAVALGYGRRSAGRTGQGRGADAWPFAREGEGSEGLKADDRRVRAVPAGGRRTIARTQIHPSTEGRPLIMETSLAAFLSGDEIGRPAGARADEGAVGAHAAGHLGHPDSMWPEFEYDGHYWAMAVDLNACIGCSGCVVGCDLENNVPVVGEEEVARYRDMHWLRIDRYYAGDPAAPEVVHQPMLCQHCDHAPCENVCPVLATVHNEEGLNVQVYNRCVGTRYCANNCPIKTRRFNWFDYPHEDPAANLALNPDVTVRTRGVMEKCSMCIQRVQAAKIAARNKGGPIPDGAVQTACQQSCPADAILFGDLNDPTSRIHEAFGSGRAYQLLEELHLDAGVRYLTKIRNSAGELGREGSHG